jgi:hypothetical protein
MPAPRNHFRHAPAAAACAACLAATACIDGHEQITIDRTGGGRATLTYHVPTAAVIANGGRDQLRQTITAWLDGEKTLTLEALELTDHDDRTRIHAELSFPSALALIDLSSNEKLERLPAAARDLAGTLDFRLRGRHVQLTRSVRAHTALGGMLVWLPRSELAAHRLVYQITLPKPATAHNATTTRDHGRTLVWDYSLADAIDTPPVMHFAADLPVPRWLWVAAILTAAIAATLIATLLRRPRRKPPETARTDGPARP